MAVEPAVDFMREKMGIVLPASGREKCAYSPRNAQCPGQLCPNYSG
ncbi:MAG: hypothetical protein JXA46_16345 [Dehalococcoidales bacterium]|nr:hypothetical protein [Dehalococcoidales bacterium]